MASTRAASRAPDYFVFGSERGGTTLLAALLSAHPDAYTLNDSFLALAAAEALGDLRDGALPRARRALAWHVKDALRRVGPLHRLLFSARAGLAGGWRPTLPDLTDLPGPEHVLRPREARAIVRRLVQRYRQFQPDEKADSFLYGYAAALEAPALRGVLADGDPTLAELLGRVFLHLVPDQRRGAARLGEKTPRHAYCAAWLARLFPAARWITLVRHPLANVAALHARMNGDLAGAIAKYMSFHGDAVAPIHDPARSLVIRYEDVIADPSASLADVHAHLGLAPHATTTPGASSRGAYIGDAIDPERDRARMRWFTGSDRARVLAECAAVLERHYPDFDATI